MKNITIIYPCGAGGEFLAWILSQLPNAASLKVLLDPYNKWNILENKFSTPIHKTTELKDSNKKWEHQYFSNVKFDKEKINVVRTHFDIPRDEIHWHLTRENINSLIEDLKYWNQSLVIVLYPKDNTSIKFCSENTYIKFIDQYNNSDMLLDIEEIECSTSYKYDPILVDKIMTSAGYNTRDVKKQYIIVDPYELFVSNSDHKINLIISILKDIFNDACGPEYHLYATFMHFMIDAWNRKNDELKKKYLTL